MCNGALPIGYFANFSDDGDDPTCNLNELVELDEAYTRCRQSAKRARVAQGQMPVLLAVERRDQGMVSWLPSQLRASVPSRRIAMYSVSPQTLIPANNAFA